MDIEDFIEVDLGCEPDLVEAPYGRKIRKCSVISCSRRTDVPAFYLDKYLKHFENGYIDIKSPYGKASRVDLSPETVKAICWWSKDYNKFIEEFNSGNSILNNYPIHYFNFTLNSESELEPNVKSSVDERLLQAEFLAKTFGPEFVKIRFDPITFYIKNSSKEVVNNLNNFEYIANKISTYGIKEILIAFCIPFNKTKNRFKKFDISFYEPNKREIIMWMKSVCDPIGIKLKACCMNEFSDLLEKSACIDGNLLKSRGLNVGPKDRNQRKECNCVTSIDIGEYSLKCPHGCLYCYANPI